MCGNCCQGTGGIVVSLEEQQHLCEFLDLDLATFLDQYTEVISSKRIIKSDDSGYCVFFEKDKGCRVHPSKPKVCRAWPFFRGNLVDQTSWEMAQDSCPGISQEISHDEFVRQGLSYLASHGLTQTRDMGANALKVTDLASK